MNPVPDKSIESNLMRRIAERETEAISQLYDRLGSWIYSIALNIVKERPDAEEVTQEVFLQTWQQAHKYHVDRGSVRAWLAIMTRRLAIDRTRSRGYREKRRYTSAEELAAEMTDGNAERNIINAAEGRLIQDAMNKLENGQSEVIHLSYYHGYSHSEIAEKLKVPLGTVKSRMRSGLRELRQLLDI